MKIALVCSHGGHLTEMLCLMNAFEGHQVFFITYNNTRTDELPLKKYVIKNIGINFFKFIIAFINCLKFFNIERPQLIVSTGSEIAIPAFLGGKLLRIKTVYIESWCRVTTASGTGKIVYFLSDRFYVQWPQLLTRYGKKAKFEGAVV